MRGKRGGVRLTCPTSRIIPAHAGQTPATPAYALMYADHPRACGANGVMMIGVNGADGSSPRMRGKLANWLRLCVSIRIIPAHAGQTSRETDVRYPAWDHPRACGANSPVNGMPVS